MLVSKRLLTLILAAGAFAAAPRTASAQWTITPFVGWNTGGSADVNGADGTTRTSKFTPEQMVHILRQGESGVPIGELCRQHQISEETCYRWKKQFGDLGTAEVRELRQLREENRKLKTLVADLTLDKTILREALGKKF